MKEPESLRGGPARPLAHDGVAFITGASQGVGAAVARAFHDAGARLALASRGAVDLIESKGARLRRGAAGPRLRDRLGAHTGRPRDMQMVTVSFRSMNEASWG